MRDTHCWRRLRKRINVSSALVISLARNCRGLKFANFENMNWNMCVTTECMRKLTNVKRPQNIRSLHEVDRHKKKRSRRAHANQVATRGKRGQKLRSTRSVCGDPPLEALKAIISSAANRKQTFSMMPIDVSRASCTFTKKLRDLSKSACQWMTEGVSTLEWLTCWDRVCMACGTQQAIGSVIGKSI